MPIIRQSELSPNWAGLGEEVDAIYLSSQHAGGRGLVGVLVETGVMYPNIPRGSAAIVDRTKTDPEDGAMGLFWVSGRAVFRRLVSDPDSGAILLRAMDPEVPPIVANPIDCICMGTVYRVFSDPN